MLRMLGTGVLALALVGHALPAAAQESYTTRIEPNGFYGATETVEHGVRVIRPLPPARQIIVNPGGRTPLSVGVSDMRVNEYVPSTNRYFYPPY